MAAAAPGTVVGTAAPRMRGKRRGRGVAAAMRQGAPQRPLVVGGGAAGREDEGMEGQGRDGIDMEGLSGPEHS